MSSVVLNGLLARIVVIHVRPALLERVQAHLALLHQPRPLPDAAADRRVLSLVPVKPLGNLTLCCRAADILRVLLSSLGVSRVNSHESVKIWCLRKGCSLACS